MQFGTCRLEQVLSGDEGICQWEEHLPQQQWIMGSSPIRAIPTVQVSTPYKPQAAPTTPEQIWSRGGLLISKPRAKGKRFAQHIKLSHCIDFVCIHRISPGKETD